MNVQFKSSKGTNNKLYVVLLYKVYIIIIIYALFPEIVTKDRHLLEIKAIRGYVNTNVYLKINFKSLCFMKCV